MRKPSDNALLQQAIDAAGLDRESLADAYSYTGAEAQDALDAVKRLNALRDKLPHRGNKPPAMDEATSLLAFQALVWAEQWEEGLADALVKGSKERGEAVRTAAAYRELRLRRWGRSAFEAMEENAVAVPIDEFMRRHSRGE